MTARVAVLGAGAFGTALAIHLAQRAEARPHVVLHARDAAQAEEIRRTRANPRYLAGAVLPARIEVTADLGAATHGADWLLAAVPAAALVPLLASLTACGADAPLAWVSKGFVASPDAPGHGLIHRRLAGLWRAPLAALSGPTFAEEVAAGLPTALAVAATDPAAAQALAGLLRAEALRVYPTPDLAGVETGGAIKNVLAIAAGASDGLGFGHNARAALITRGLAETGRLLRALGGRPETLMGLAGLGDLVLTCTSDRSRNRRVGLALAQGRALPAILADLGHVAEGVPAARAAAALAAHHRVDMPIVAAVNRVLHDGLAPADAVRGLLTREPRAETE